MDDGLLLYVITKLPLSKQSQTTQLTRLKARRTLLVAKYEILYKQRYPVLVRKISLLLTCYGNQSTLKILITLPVY